MRCEYQLSVLGTVGMNTHLNNAGRIQLPVAVQTQLGVKPGDELTLEEENGKWLIKPVDSTNDSPGGGSSVEDLNWEDLDYHSVPLAGLRKVAVRIEQRGRLKPMVHDLDDE
jgi:bifunctional DNA-binding transcriptional regulator/antitoxin component of YhaV-PrlF toxin-antitoxin module